MGVGDRVFTGDALFIRSCCCTREVFVQFMNELRLGCGPAMNLKTPMKTLSPIPYRASEWDLP
jgi:hypothetical protein